MKKNLVFICVLLLLTSCSTQTSLPYIQIETNEAPSKGEMDEGKDQVVIALASVVSPEETRNKYDLLMNYLEEKLQRDIVVVQKQTYDEVNQLLNKGAVDIGFICSLSYVLGTEDRYMEGLVAPEIDGSSLYQSYIITRKNSGLNYFGELKDKRFAFTDPFSYSGRLSVLYTLEQIEYSAEEYFGEIYYTYSHDNSIQAVLGGVVDGASVDSALYHQWEKLHPESLDELQVIEKGPKAGTPPVVASRSVDPELKNEVTELLLNMADTNEGKRILKELGIDRYVPVDYQLYQPMTKMLHLLGDSNETN